MPQDFAQASRAPFSEQRRRSPFLILLRRTFLQVIVLPFRFLMDQVFESLHSSVKSLSSSSKAASPPSFVGNVVGPM